MLYLGDWQLRRAESGNALSWAYTFEWPLFAIFGVYFWVKTLRDELKNRRLSQWVRSVYSSHRPPHSERVSPNQ